MANNILGTQAVTGETEVNYEYPRWLSHNARLVHANMALETSLCTTTQLLSSHARNHCHLGSNPLPYLKIQKYAYIDRTARQNASKKSATEGEGIRFISGL